MAAGAPDHSFVKAQNCSLLLAVDSNRPGGCRLPFLDKSTSSLARMEVLRSGLGEWPSLEHA